MPHKYSHNISVFTKQDSLSYYLLGAYITDGCVSKNGCSLTTELKSKDLDWLESIRNIISPQSLVQKTKGNCYRLRISSKELANWLIEHNCVPRKSLTVRMPNVPNEYLPDFIRGCIDGDGSLGIYTRSNGTSNKKYSIPICYIVSASREFISEMKTRLNKLGLHCTTQVKKTKNQITILKNGQRIVGRHDQYIIKFTGRYCKDILSFCYYPNHLLSMKRKCIIADNIII